MLVFMASFLTAVPLQKCAAPDRRSFKHQARLQARAMPQCFLTLTSVTMWRSICPAEGRHRHRAPRFCADCTRWTVRGWTPGGVGGCCLRLSACGEKIPSLSLRLPLSLHYGKLTPPPPPSGLARPSATLIQGYQRARYGMFLCRARKLREQREEKG